MATNGKILYDYFEMQENCPDTDTQQLFLTDHEKLRRRKQELRLLIRRVIKNELSEQDRLLVRLHWYQGKSVSEIAPLIGLSRSSVYRRLERINETIYEKLKYALEYRFDRGVSQEDWTALLPKASFARNAAGASIGERLKKSRCALLLSTCELCRAAGLQEERLRYLEQHGGDMTMHELKALTKALGISTDALIFGYQTAGLSPGGKGLLSE